jgi:IMP dehydrogenase
MKLREHEGLTFDDVLLVPKRSSIASRTAVNTGTKLSKRLNLAIPIISANMDTVTEAPMAIAMARAGGLGVVHRFMTIDQQAREVSRVKRAESYVVESPESIRPDISVAEAKAQMQVNDIGGFLVMDGEALIGILTMRDVLLAPDATASVRSVMTPRSKLIVGVPNIAMSEARRMLHEHHIEKLPLVDAQGRVHGLITTQDLIKQQDFPNATKDSKGRLRVGAAIGVRRDDLERAAACVNVGADVLVVDIAHGHSDHEIEMIKQLKLRFPTVDVIGGNVATADGVRDLAAAGADAIKVGVGSGSICITRVVTGFGVPQLTAILDCAEAAKALGVPLISDGGIRTSGDLTKALAAGADSVMVGSLLAGTEESPGASVIRNGRRFKVVRGMASLTANIDRKVVEKGGAVDNEDWEKVVPEGVEAVVPFRGAAKDVLYQLVGGLRSGLSYAGATCIHELQHNAEFLRMSPASMRESGSHDVQET